MSSSTDTHRTKLLAAARKLLRERDYGTITARDLVAASDTNLGSIGYHFGSKEALLNEAIGLALEEWVDTLEVAIDAGGGDGLTALMTSSLAGALDHYDAVRPYYQAFIAALARSARAPALRAQLAAHYERQRDRITNWILDAVEAPLDPEQARDAACLMLAAADGMLIQSFIDRDAVPTSGALGAAIDAALGAIEEPAP